jgi:hypothetical protein
LEMPYAGISSTGSSTPRSTRRSTIMSTSHRTLILSSPSKGGLYST